MENQCVAPEEISDSDLVDYVDGLAASHVGKHLARCPSCTQKVNQLRTELAYLATAVYRAYCPHAEDLLLYQAGLLDKKESQFISSHLPTCTYCQAELHVLESVSPVATFSKTLPAMISQRLHQTGKQLLDVMRVLAQPAQPALAFRGGERIRETYQAGNYQLGLVKVAPIANEESWQLEGQLVNQADLDASLEGSVQLLTDEKAVASDVIDEFGYFALAEIPSGNYTLNIEVGSHIIPILDFLIP